MRTVCVCAIALLTFACSGAEATSPQGASLTGYWCSPAEVGPSALVLTQTGSSVSGKVANYYWYDLADTSYVTGNVSDGTVTLVLGNYEAFGVITMTGSQPGATNNLPNEMRLKGSSGGYPREGDWYRDSAPDLVTSACANRYP